MINYNEIVYEFDPVYAIFNKSNYQSDIEVSNQFPDRIRIEKRVTENLHCKIVLAAFTGKFWNLITGLLPISSFPGYFVGNILISQTYNKSSRKTEMAVIHNNGLAGELLIYHFPNFDMRTAAQRMKAAKDFISFLNKKIGQP